MKFRVDIKEDYTGCQHYHVRIFADGFGAGHKGFILMDVEELEKEFGADAQDILRYAKTFRPEYAKTIKYHLDGAEV